MSLDHEFSENLIALNKCRMNYSIIWWAYCIMAAADILLAVVSNIAAWGADTPILLIDAVIFVPMIWILGTFGAHKHSDAYAVLAAVATAANAILLRIGSFLVTGTIFAGMGDVDIKYNVIEKGARWYLAMTVISVLAMLLNLKTNRTYRFLEDQIGFPYFNLRYEEQKLDRVQRGIKDEFQQYAERLKKTESSEMAELTLPAEQEPGAADEV